MNLLPKSEIEALISQFGGPHVSLYMPAIRAGRETQENSIRFKNLLRLAEESLLASGLRPTQAAELLEPAMQLLTDEEFWQHQSDGLAVFSSNNIWRHYRLPLDFDELHVVTESFHIKPLLPLFNSNGRFFILAMSQNKIRLLEGTRYTVDEVDTDEMPQSLAQALKWDDPEAQLQHHSSEGPSTGGERAMIFHGHGVGTDDQKTNILRYFHKIDRGLQQILGDEKVPLLLAGVDYLHPIYQQANTYQHLLPEGVKGNPDELKAEELHQKAWEIVEPYFLQEQQQSIELYNQVYGQGGQRASTDIFEVVPAAVYGRIEHLFLASGIHQWGRFDPEQAEIELHPEARPQNRDLLDLAAAHTFINGGQVHVIEQKAIPGGQVLAAIFRYELNPEAS
jgi:hypothetical protein